MHTYIGSFVCKSGVFVVADPSINSLTCEIMNINQGINKDFLHVLDVMNGCFHAFHSLDTYNYCIKELNCIHDSYSLDDLKNFTRKEVGRICTTFSSSVSLCDQDFSFNSSFCYYMIEKDAYYNTDDILASINDMSYSLSTKEELRKFCYHCKDNNTHPTGSDILSVTNNEMIWEGFRSSKIASSHWSEDANRRLTHEPAAVIMGGVLSRTKDSILPCYSYYDLHGKCIAVTITLFP